VLDTALTLFAERGHHGRHPMYAQAWRDPHVRTVLAADAIVSKGSIMTGRRGIREGLESGSQRGSMRVVQVIEYLQRALPGFVRRRGIAGLSLGVTEVGED
jgi:hypothetical protein